MAKRTRASACGPRKTAKKTSSSRTKNAAAARRSVFTPQLLAYARHRYEHTDATNADIAVDLGVHKSTVGVVAKREGWRRYVPPPRDMSPAVQLLVQVEKLEADAARNACRADEPAEGSPRETASGDQDAGVQGQSTTDALADADIVERIYRAVVEELTAVEAMRAQLRRHPQSAVEAERTARTLSSLTEIFQKLKRLQITASRTGPDDDDMPADIDEFRRNLARRIDAFVESRAEPHNAGGDAGPARMDAT